MLSYLLFICFILLWFFSLSLTAKFNIKEFNFTATRIFAQAIKSLIIIGLLFVSFYLILPPFFKVKYSLSVIYASFALADIAATIFILLFAKKTVSHGVYGQSLISDPLPLPKQISLKENDIEQEVNHLFNLDALYKSAITQLIKDCCNGKVNLYGPIKALTETTEVSENYNNLGCLIVTPIINNIPYLNKTLLNYYNAISNHGLIILNYITYDQAKLYKLLKSNPLLKYIVYPWYFFFTRAIPKIPIIEKVYFFCTNNKYKTISKAECWGRLHYTGFEVLGEGEYNGLNIVLARKSYTPSSNKKPSYYPVIKLRRVSLNGKIVMIYKIRSMFPYSEYIQKKIFEAERLSTIGKFINDFRITGYGHFIRKYYIDEVIQIINFLRGDIKVVGIRAMSEHFFSLYPEKYQQLYYKVKPGFLSPLPEKAIESFNDVVNLEMKYLEQYLQSPIKTDIKYFFKIIYQLLFQRRVST